MKIAIRIAMSQPGRWRAWCPALPGCHAVGQSRDEVADKIDLAIRGYIASLNAAVPKTIRTEVPVAARGQLVIG
jgi:predicted RNase H-like HicB family nuclease